LLRPKLHGERGGGGEDGADGDAEEEFPAGIEAGGLPARGGEETCRDPSESGAGGDLQDAECAVGMALGVVTDEDDVDGVECGGDEGEDVAAIEAGEAFYRDRQEIQTDDCAEGAGVGPAREMFSPKNCEEQRDEDDAGAGDESGFCGRGVEEACGLEGVAAEHEDAESGACEEFFPVYGAESFGAVDGHQGGGEGEAQGEEDEDAGVGERVFYDDEGGAPEEGADDQSEVGFDGRGLSGCRG